LVSDYGFDAGGKIIPRVKILLLLLLLLLLGIIGCCWSCRVVCGLGVGAIRRRRLEGRGGGLY
jgi:hypothetical protein